MRKEILASFLILGKKVSSFSPLGMILAIEFLVDFFVKLRNLLEVFFFSFIMNGCWIFKMLLIESHNFSLLAY